MSKRWLGLALTALALSACTTARTRYADPYDRVVLPLRPGAVAQAAVPPGPTTGRDGAGAPGEPALRSYVVLLADADGTVGRVEVEAGGESVVLDQANQAVDFSDLARTFEAGSEELEVFSRALAAEPPAAVRFLVHFDLDRAEPAGPEIERARASLAPVLAWSAPELVIEGHADRSGSEAFNQALSQRRADAVRRLLETEGLEAVSTELRAFGESRPAIATQDGVAEARNRRVVVTIR